MRTVAILPVKRFVQAKQRLGDAVGETERRELAGAMVLDVLTALTTVKGLAELIVVTSEPAASEAAKRIGAQVVEDRDEAGQSAAAELGLTAARKRKAERALLVPGDCPTLDASELDLLLAAPRVEGPTVVIVPDRHGHGTNALLLAPTDAVAPSFGPGSFARHAALARAAGARIKVAQVPSLELDVDTPDDLGALHSALAERPETAAHTRAVLARLTPAPAGARPA